MVRTSMLAAAAGLSRTSSGAMRSLAGTGLNPGLQGGGSAAFTQLLAEVLMTRQDRPHSVTGGRQEFPRALRNSGDAHLSRMMLRSSLGRSSSRGRSYYSSNRAASGSEAERLFNSAGSRNSRPVDPKAFDGLIKTAAARYQVPEELVKAVIKVESNFNPQATSHMGAMGLMQLMPATARDLGVSQPYDPQQNINGGTKYLRELLDRYDGNVPKAVAAYNCGMGNVERGRLPQETRSYLQLVRRHYSGSQNLSRTRNRQTVSVPESESVAISDLASSALPTAAT